jgi:hypothetical protein
LYLGTSTHAHALNVGGLEVSPGSTFAVTQLYENVPVAVGDTLSGYGKVDSINSIAVADLCAGCELTYQFGGYTVSSVSPTAIKFTGGFVKLYLGFGADKDFTTSNAGGSAGDLVEATNGTLFLALKGHPVDAAGNTFIGMGVDIGTLSPTGFGTGLLDVDTSAGGVATTVFDTNAVAALFGGAADFEFGYSFSALHPAYAAECPGGPACVRGSGDLTGTADAVPEPASHAVFLIALGAFGFIVRRQLI